MNHPKRNSQEEFELQAQELGQDLRAGYGDIAVTIGPDGITRIPSRLNKITPGTADTPTGRIEAEYGDKPTAIQADTGIVFPQQISPETRRRLGIPPEGSRQPSEVAVSFLLNVAEVIDEVSDNPMEPTE